MSNLISLPFKKNEASHFWNSLNNSFPNLSSKEQEQYDKELRNLDSLRQKISSVFNKDSVNICSDTLSFILEYYSQLTLIKDKIVPNQVNFTWGNSFNDQQQKANSADILFELSNIIYNAGVTYSKSGEKEPRNSSEGIVLSCKYFQEAAGAFKFLQEKLHGNDLFPIQFICDDLDFHSLDFNINLMLAQAQECTWQKATITCSQLAGHVSVLYSQALEAAAHESVKNLIPKDMLTHIRVKSLHFKAVSQFRFSHEFRESNKIGYEIAYLTMADGIVTEAMSLCKELTRSELLKNLLSLDFTLKENLSRVLKYNNWVYFQSIPIIKDHLPTRLMVEAKISNVLNDPIKELSDKSITPLMSYLKPFVFYQAPILYQSRKEHFVENVLIKPLQNIIFEYSSILKNNPTQDLFLSDTSAISLPSALSEKIDRVHTLGGVENLKATSASLLNLRKEMHSLLESKLSEISKIFIMVNNLPEIPKESETLYSKVNLFRDRFLDASKTDEETLDSIKKYNDVFSFISLNKSAIIKSIPQHQALLPIVGKEEKIKKIKSLLAEQEESVRKCNSNIKEIRGIFLLDDITETIDMLHLSTEYNDCANISDIDQIISKELKKYSRFQNSVKEQQTACSLFKKEFIDLLESTQNLDQGESKTVSAGSYFNHLTDTCDQFLRLFSALEAGIKDRLNAFHNDCKRLLTEASSS